MFPDPATRKEEIEKSLPFLILDRKTLMVLARIRLKAWEDKFL
jgi:hypothetical protein